MYTIQNWNIRSIFRNLTQLLSAIKSHNCCNVTNAFVEHTLHAAWASEAILKWGRGNVWYSAHFSSKYVCRLVLLIAFMERDGKPTPH